jgi:hypothetical protein
MHRTLCLCSMHGTYICVQAVHSSYQGWPLTSLEWPVHTASPAVWNHCCHSTVHGQNRSHTQYNASYGHTLYCDHNSSKYCTLTPHWVETLLSTAVYSTQKSHSFAKMSTFTVCGWLKQTSAMQTLYFKHVHTCKGLCTATSDLLHDCSVIFLIQEAIQLTQVVI